MIIGNGDLASVLPQRDDLTFFASGVSNSRETRESEYEREKTLLMQQDTKKHLVYFSSLAIFYSDTQYTQHKILMEKMVKAYFHKSTIIRIGNITWGINPNTLINTLRNKFKNGEELDIQDVYRYIVDKEEFLHWINLIPDWDCEMNIPGKRMKIQEIVDTHVKS